MSRQNEDAIVWGLSAGLLILIAVLAYLTHLKFKYNDKSGIAPSQDAIKWVRALRKKSSLGLAALSSLRLPSFKKVATEAPESGVNDEVRS